MFRLLGVSAIVFCVHVEVLGDIPEGSTPGLRAYWNTNARTADRVGHVDWEQYDHVTQIDQVHFPKTQGAFYEEGPSDYFGLRVTGQIDIPEDGIWTFKLESDQSAILFIDGEPLVIDVSSHSFRSWISIIDLSEGLHDFEVRYWEGWSDAGLVVYWDGPGMDQEEVIPSSAFSSPAADPVYDPGGEGVWAYWFHNIRHASNAGQIDWVNPDKVSKVARPSYRKTQSGFTVGGPVDYFGARFVGVITIDEEDEGEWVFDLGSDQSAIMYIDGEPVVSDTSGHSFRWRSGTVNLDEGEHTIDVRYWEGWSDAALHVAWQGPRDQFREIIPSSAFKPGIGATSLPSGGGVRAYRYDNARHAYGVSGMSWENHSSVETVQNIYQPITRDPMYLDGPSDYFALRYVGKINFPRSGEWTIGVGSDQSSRMYLDNQMLIDDTTSHSFRWRYGTQLVEAGKVGFELQFWEGWSDSGVVLTWKGPGDEFETVIPASAFSLYETDPSIGTGGDGLMVYWVDQARHASKVGHIDWQNYDRTTIESHIGWEITQGVFPGTDDSDPDTGGVNADYFGLRAVGLIDIPIGGEWAFGLGADQSAQLYIDGKLIVNDDTSHSYRWRHGTIELESGKHAFEVRYWDGWSDAGLNVTWKPPGGVETIIPPSAYSHPDQIPEFDTGGGGLRAYWVQNARHASNVGQIDWAKHDHSTIIPNIAWRISRNQFDTNTPVDYFGVKLVGQIEVPSGGEWTFSLGSDQSAVMLIDDEPVVVDTTSHSYRWRTGTVHLSEGKHKVEVQYWDGWSDNGLHLAWKGPTVLADTIVPRTAFSLLENETPFEPGGGLRAYWTPDARHASNAGQIDYAKHGSSSIVDRVSWPITRDSFYLDGPSDYFGLRLIGRINIPESGEWGFSVGADQSVILLIDDEPVVVDTTSHSYRWRSGTMTLSEGEHKFEVRYWDGWSDAGLNVTWKGPSDGFEEIIPSSAFDLYDPEPVFDDGEASLKADWYVDTRDDSFESMDWSDPDLSTIEPRVNWNRTSSSFESAVPSDYFSLRVSGKLMIPTSGLWTFGVGSDQYAQLLIDGEPIVSDTIGHSYRWRHGEVELEQGVHELELRFKEGWSDAGLYLSWRGPDELFESIIPASAFEPKSDQARIVQWREIGEENNR